MKDLNTKVTKEENNLPPLPEGWAWTTITDIADTTSGGTPSRKYPEYFQGTIPWVKSGELGDGFISKTEEKITGDALRNSSAKLFPSGTVLVALYGATVGKVGILKIDAASNQAVCALFPRNNSFTAKYMFYWLMSQRQELINKSMGGAQPNISQGIVRSHPFPLSPLPEQERIVARLEELLSDMEAGVAALERVRIGAKRYIATVLKAACEGKLFGEKGLKNGELPEGWRWATVGEVSKKIQYGTSEKANLDDTGVPVLRMGNVQDGQLDYARLKYLPEDSVPDNLILEPGDLIFNRTNSAELVGKTAIYKSNHPKATYASYLIRVKMVPDVSSDFISFYINSLHGRKYISSVVSQQVGQANVNGTKLAKMPLPLPPFEEQKHIVADVERRFESVRAVEAAVEAGLKRAGRLRQAVLRSAFEGRLG